MRDAITTTKLENYKTEKLKDYQKPISTNIQNSFPVFQSSSFKAIENTQDAVITKELSPTMNLSVPFTSQAPEQNWDEPWQDACEEAAVLMLDAY